MEAFAQQGKEKRGGSNRMAKPAATLSLHPLSLALPSPRHSLPYYGLHPSANAVPLPCIWLVRGFSSNCDSDGEMLGGAGSDTQDSTRSSVGLYFQYPLEYCTWYIVQYQVPTVAVCIYILSIHSDSLLLDGYGCSD